ncbi:MAG: 3-hydroxyacyl-CoA dehydrogenase NAD-binding domain-containing protein [Patescibacteria group bacterium]
MAINKVLVVGGGTMGADIARVVVKVNRQAVIKELNEELAEKAKEKVYAGIDRALTTGKIDEQEANTQKSLLRVTHDFIGLDEPELLVIEAVPEKLDLKQRIFAELEQQLPEDAIFSSNTSSLPIKEIAKGLKNKSRLLGIHFFNPPTRMQLVEIISSEFSNPNLVSEAEEFVQMDLQKSPIRVKDCPGFLMNRLLGAYLKPALAILEQRLIKPELIDKEATSFGWPAGPFLLMDALGLDVCLEVMGILCDAYPDQFRPSRILKLLVEKGRRGQKSGSGFYSYAEEAEPVLSLIKNNLSVLGEPDNSADSAKEVFEDEMNSLVNEAAICLEEGVASAEDIEKGCLLGIGFPMSKSGPLAWANETGLSKILMRLKNPCVALEKMAKTNGRFPV